MDVCAGVDACAARMDWTLDCCCSITLQGSCVPWKMCAAIVVPRTRSTGGEAGDVLVVSDDRTTGTGGERTGAVPPGRTTIGAVPPGRTPIALSHCGKTIVA